MKKWLAALLTVVMIATLVPFSVVPALATTGEVYEITSGTDHPLWGKLSPGSNYPAGNTPATAGDTVKLMTNVTIGDPSSNVKGDGVTLDLNGHTIASSKQPGLAVIATGAGARVVDMEPGRYTLYKSITTTGKQYLTTGLTLSEVTGMTTRTTTHRMRGSSAGSFFLGGSTLKSSGGSGYAATNYAFYLATQDYRYNGLQYRFCYNNGDGSVTNCRDASVAMNVDTPFVWDIVFNSGVQKITVDGSEKLNQVNADYTVPPTDNAKNYALNLFNISNDENYANLIQTSTDNVYTALAKNGTAETASNPDSCGRLGWDGTTEYVKLYQDPANTASNTNLVRDLIPAKSPSGKLGMIDKIEGVFYPLLGEVQYASVATETGYAIIDANGKTAIHPVIEVASSGAHPLYGIIGTGDYIPAGAPINRVAAPGEIIRLTCNSNHSDPVWNFAVTGVTLDLNGYTLSAKGVTNAVNVKGAGSRVVDMKAGTYKLYDSITTTGKQYLATGLTLSEVTGMTTRTTTHRMRGSSAGSYFLGGSTLKSSGGSGYAATNYAYYLVTQDNRYNGLQYRFSYNNGDGSVTNCKDASVAMNVDTPFVWDIVFNSGVQKITVDGSEKINQVNAAYTVPPADNAKDYGLNLFNISNENDYNNLIQTSTDNVYTALAKNGTAETASNPDFCGRLGWDGTTEYVKLYQDPANTASNTNLVRDLVPATRADGLIGMFDKVEGLFYPLLGATEYASVGEEIGTATINADHSVTYVDASKDNDLQRALDALEAPETYTMTADFTDAKAELVVPTGIVLDVAGFALSVKSFEGSVTDTKLSGSITVTGTFNGISADPDNVVLKTNDNVTTFSAPEDPADELMEDITNNENITVTESVDLTGKGDVEFIADQEITLEADTTLTVDTLTIDAATKISGEGTIVTETLVVNGELENWLPVEVEENTYKFIDTSEGVFDDGESDYFVPDDGNTSMGASVFGLTESMTEAIKTVLQDDEYQVVLVATVTHHDMLNFENAVTGERKESEDSNGTLTLEFDVTNLLKATDQDITDLYVMFTGVNVAYMSNISVNAEFRNANYTLNADRFEDLVSEDLK